MKTLLVVEDDSDIYEYYRILLGDSGIDYLSQKLSFSKKGDSLEKEKIPEMVTE